MNLSWKWIATTAGFVAFAALLSGCGTTYQVTQINDQHLARASAMFAQEQNTATAKAGRRLSQSQATRQFNQVVRRVEPVAEQFCRKETQGQAGFDCDIQIRINPKMTTINASQSYDKGRPVVAFSPTMIADARSADELAFVMGHEMGHHLAQHINKQKQQAVAGALILGLAAAAAGSSSGIDAAMDLGSAVGSSAFSQSYELEADVIGTFITRSAGYDPVKGARFFARPENPKHQNGELSFWGTHPPDAKRIATVLATVEKIDQGGQTALIKTERAAPLLGE